MFSFSKVKSIVLATLMMASVNAFAAGGGHSLGGVLITTGASQDDINTLIDQANTSAGGITTKSLNSAWEFAAHYTYRFSGSMFAFHFRPSYFTQSTTGTGTGGDYDYSLSGFTAFPMFRLIPLENNFIKFYMQLGLGYGKLNGKITEADASIDFSGSAFGAMGGIGAEFCFTDTHCMTLEGNVRYLPIERNIASAVSGSFTSLTRAVKNKEVEYADSDLKTTMSGVQGVIGYVFNF